MRCFLLNFQYVRLVVDHCMLASFNNGVEDRSICEASGYTRGENVFLNVVQVLQLGGQLGIPSSITGITNQGFNGCVRNLVHNAEVIFLGWGGGLFAARGWGVKFGNFMHKEYIESGVLN